MLPKTEFKSYLNYLRFFCGGFSLVFVLLPVPARADSWCTTVSYSAALSAGMNRNLGSNVSTGTQGQQCFPTHDACESARQSASSGVTSTSCTSQTGSNAMPGSGNGITSAKSPMSSNTYRPNYSSGTRPEDTAPTTLVEASHITLERPWEPPPTCAMKFPKFAVEYGEQFKRYRADQDKLDAYAVRCSGIEAGSIVEAACNKQRQAMQSEVNSYLQAVQSLNETDRDRCNQYVAGVIPVSNATVAWKKGLTCAVSDIAGRAANLGPAGRSFSDQLRRDADAAQFSPPQSAQGDDDVSVAALSVSNLLSLQRKSGGNDTTTTDAQLIADIQVVGHASDGSIVIVAVSALEDTTRHRSDERTTTLIFDRAGNVVGGEYTSAVKACLR